MHITILNYKINFQISPSLLAVLYYMLIFILTIVVTLVTVFKIKKLGLRSVKRYDRRTLCYGFIGAFLLIAAAFVNVFFKPFLCIFIHK